MNVTVLGSGSRGNSLVVDFGTSRIAVDAGYGTRTLATRMRAAGIAPASVDACALTHEHVDHAQGAIAARDKWHWTLVATGPTLAAIGAGNAAAHTQPLRYGESAAFGDARVTLIPVSHDAAAPAAVLIEHAPSGARIGVAQDLGEVSDALITAFARLDILVLEANHDAGMLRAGPYPSFLQDRIAGSRGHLSNAQSADFVAQVSHRGLRALVLAHLSRQNNTPELARTSLRAVLRGTRFRGMLLAAAQDAPGTVGDRATTQLTLF